jgi:hypothetical protein
MSKRILIVAVLAGCGGSGMSAAVRDDINARMESAKPAITECYAKELKLDRKLRGMMVLQFNAAPSSGKFEGISVLRDDMNNPQLQQCVTGAVGTLQLAKPQKTKVNVTYPLDFAPTK